MNRILRYVALVVFLTASGPVHAQSKDLRASMAQIPHIAETPEKGVFIELVKALDEVYTDGKITIELFPFGRSMQNVTDGTVDFHIPSFVSPGLSDATFPYSWVPEPMGSFTMMIYSQPGHPLTKKDLVEAAKKGGKFPYVVEVGGGTEIMFPFPTAASNDQVASLKKLDMKRIDAVIFGIEADMALKELKLKNVHRGAYEKFDDVILVPKSPRGEEAKKKLDAAMKKLKASGKLQEIYGRAHQPFTEWQPADMGW